MRECLVQNHLEPFLSEVELFSSIYMGEKVAENVEIKIPFSEKVNFPCLLLEVIET